MLSFTVYFRERGKWWQGCVFLPILALKPNLGIPIILLLSFYLVLRRKILALVAGGFSGLVLIYVGLVQNPNWIVEFWRAGNTKLSTMFGFSPTIWGALHFSVGTIQVVLFLWGTRWASSFHWIDLPASDEAKDFIPKPGHQLCGHSRVTVNALHVIL
jgi:hypothetical protein